MRLRPSVVSPYRFGLAACCEEWLAFPSTSPHCFGCAACCEDAAPPFRQLALPPRLRRLLSALIASAAPSRPKLTLSPNDSINIHQQRFIIQRTCSPDPCTRPSIVGRFLHHPRPHRIVMRVIYFLHEETLTEDRKNILLLLPERVAIVSITHLVLKFCK